MAKIEMTDDLRRRLAGFMPFEDDIAVPIVHPLMKDHPAPLTIYVKPYTVKGLARRRAYKETGGYHKTLVGLFRDGEGLGGFDNMVNSQGESVAYSAESMPKLEGLEAFLEWADLAALSFTIGLSEEERRALG